MYLTQPLHRAMRVQPDAAATINGAPTTSIAGATGSAKPDLVMQNRELA